MISSCLILAGGLGTRLKDVLDDRPKAMAPVNGKPFLEYQIEFLVKQKITGCILSVGYRAEMIKNHFSKGFHDMIISFYEEKEPLGTGGAILAATGNIDHPVFVMNGDSFFNIDLRKLEAVWNEKNPDLVMALKEMPDVSRYGSVNIDNDGRVTTFREKGSEEGQGLINGGIYLFNPSWLRQKSKEMVKFSFEKDILAECLNSDYIAGVPFKNYFIDIGIPSDYQKAQHDFASGKL